MPRTSWHLNRRTFLRGAGLSLALPWLEAMGSLELLGASDGRKFPNRMAFLYVPNGKNMADWTPKADGANFELPAILKPLAPVKDELLVLTGLNRVSAARRESDHPPDRSPPLLGSFSSLIDSIQAMATPATLIHNSSANFQVRHCNRPFRSHLRSQV